MADYLRKYKFKISWPTVGNTGTVTTVAGCTRVSGIGRSQDVIEHRAGDDPGAIVTKIPGLVKYSSITLEKGMSANQDFIKWCQDMVDTTAESLLKKDIQVDVLDKTGAISKTYSVKNAWPSSVQIDDLDSNSSGLMFERLTLEFESFTIYPGAGSAGDIKSL